MSETQDVCANCGKIYGEHLLWDGNKCKLGSINGWFPKRVADAIRRKRGDSRASLAEDCLWCPSKAGETCQRYDYDHPGHPKERGSDVTAEPPAAVNDCPISKADGSPECIVGAHRNAMIEDGVIVPGQPAAEEQAQSEQGTFDPEKVRLCFFFGCCYVATEDYDRLLAMYRALKT